MGIQSKKAIKNGEKTQKQILNEFVSVELLSPRFKHEDRILVAKLMQREYRAGFLNGKNLK